MISIPLAILLGSLIVSVCVAVCWGFYDEIAYLRRRNKALRQTLDNMARMENLNANTSCALMNELTKCRSGQYHR